MIRFFFDQDNGSHWYMIPEKCKEKWNEWLNIPSDDERSWEAPEFAQRLDGGPEAVTFVDPKGGGVNS